MEDEAMAKKKNSTYQSTYYKTTAEPKAMAGNIPVFCAYDELVPIEKVIGNPKNPNHHPDNQIDLLAKIIEAQGWRAPITVSKRSGFIVKGHGRLQAALKIGTELVPIDYQDYANESEEYADLIADNRIAELAEINTTEIADLITEMDVGEIPIELTGYTSDDIENIISAITGEDDTEDDQMDDVPEISKLCISKPGDIWCCGQHRIICGDSTNPDTIDKLMQGDKAQVVNTDPPYGVSYESDKFDKIANDELTQDDLMNKLLIPVFKNYMKYTNNDAAFYIWHASSTRRDFEDAMNMVGLIEKQYLIWVKNSIVLGRADYQWQHEPCFYAEKAGQSCKWYGDRTQSTTWKVIMRNSNGMAAVLTGGIVLTDGAGNRVFVSEKPPKGKKTRYVRLSDGGSITLMQESSQNTIWEVARETNTEHPTQKPVELAVRAISNSSDVGDIVLDFFGGSHSTMIGSELTGRQARICELEPKYVDVGILRYVKLKGTDTVFCERDGKRYGLLEICEHVATKNGVTIEGLIDGTYAIPADGDSNA